MSIEKFKDFRIFHFETHYFCYSCPFLFGKLFVRHEAGHRSSMWKNGGVEVPSIWPSNWGIQTTFYHKTPPSGKKKKNRQKKQKKEKKRKKKTSKKISLTKPLQTRATLTAIQTNRGKKHPQYKNYKIPSRQLILLTHTILKACKMNPLDPRHLHARNYLPLFDSTRFKTKTKKEKKTKIKC